MLMPCQLFAQNAQLIVKKYPNIKMFGVPPEHFAIGNMHRNILLLVIITLQHVIQNNVMVLFDVMVHLLKIETNFNKSTKTFLWL